MSDADSVQCPVCWEETLRAALSVHLGSRRCVGRAQRTVAAVGWDAGEDTPAPDSPKPSPDPDAQDGPSPKRRRVESTAQRPASGRAVAVLRLEPVARRVFAAIRRPRLDGGPNGGLLRRRAFVCRAFAKAFSPKLRLRRATIHCDGEHAADVRAALPHLRLRKLTIIGDFPAGAWPYGRMDSLRGLLAEVCDSPTLQASLTKLVIKSTFTGRLNVSGLKTLPHLRFVHIQDLSGSNTETVLRRVAPAQLQGFKLTMHRNVNCCMTESQLKVLERFPGLRRLGLTNQPTMTWGILSEKSQDQLNASLTLPFFERRGPKDFEGPADLASLERVSLGRPERLSLLTKSLGSLVVVSLVLPEPGDEPMVTPLNQRLRALGAMSRLRELQLCVHGKAAAALTAWTGLSETRLERLSLRLPAGVGEGRRLPVLWVPETLRSFRLSWKKSAPEAVDQPLEGGPILADTQALPRLRTLKVSGPAWLAAAVVGPGRRLAALESLRLVDVFFSAQRPNDYGNQPGAFAARIARSSPSLTYSLCLTGREVAERGGVATAAARLETRLRALRSASAANEAGAALFHLDCHVRLLQLKNEQQTLLKKMDGAQDSVLRRLLNDALKH